MKTGLILKIALALVLALPFALTAQERDLSPLQRGVIDNIMQDDGYIVVSGRRLDYREADVDISYRGQPLPASFLSAGQNIEYRTHSDGSVRTIIVTAPNRDLDEVAAQ